MNLELTPEEQELQDLMDKLANEIYSQLGISRLQAETAVKTTINAYDAYMQEKLEEEKYMDDYDIYRMNLLAHAIIELNEKAGHVIDSETEERIRIAFKHIFEEKENKNNKEEK